jgi:undecaprenyl diphosphate synthase
MFQSTTLSIPDAPKMPQHIAIIMDGNGRWAAKRKLPRIAGHTKGVEAVRNIVRACIERGVAYLTLFAFSSENWRRPVEEVSLLMRLFTKALEREVTLLDENQIRLKIVGDLSAFSPVIQNLIQQAETRTAQHQRLTLTIAANYGGRWDILQAMQKLLDSGQTLSPINEEKLSPYLSMSYAPEPDLFIRTGGEQRISNFLLWQLAYAELYFTDVFWPDFNATELEQALSCYQQRERRFGCTSAQLGG